MKKIALLCLLLSFFTYPNGLIYFTKVTRVIDGDTFKTSAGQTIRLINIDAPEINTSAGQKSTARSNELINNKYIFLIRGLRNTDKYGRSLREAYIGFNSLSKILVSENLARELNN